MKNIIDYIPINQKPALNSLISHHLNFQDAPPIKPSSLNCIQIK